MNWKIKLILAEIGVLAVSMLAAYVIMAYSSRISNVSNWHYDEWAFWLLLTTIFLTYGSFIYFIQEISKMLNK